MNEGVVSLVMLMYRTYKQGRKWSGGGNPQIKIESW